VLPGTRWCLFARAKRDAWVIHVNTNRTVQLGITVRPSQETNDHEVVLLGTGENLIDQFSKKMMGLDPDQLLVEPCPLHASETPRVATIGRCGCGEVGCGSVEVEIRRENAAVKWRSLDSPLEIQFDASQYEAEIERALRDHSWETPDRTVARLIGAAVDKAALERRGFAFSWVSGRCRQGSMTVSLMLSPGPYQVLVNLPWDGTSVQSIVDQFASLLRGEPASWPDVDCYPQVQRLGPPPFEGPGWRTARSKK
jgi:hypothetical protein